MRRAHGPLRTLGLAALLGTSAAALAADEGSSNETATLSYQALPKWSLILPKESWKNADEYCGVPHAGDPGGFAVEQSGLMALEVDTNGDGELDQKIKGAQGFARLRGKDEDGEAFEYAVRFRYDGGYRWSPGGAMVGKLRGQTIRLIDQNGDGTYDQAGVDALIVGASDAASFLSSVVNLDGELWNLEVSPNGGRASVTPFEGETGTLDLASGFRSQGALASAVVKARELSFELAGAPNGLKVPAGTYELAYGFAVRAGETVHIGKGKTKPIDVRAGEKAELGWGGPIVAEFDYRVRGETITVQADVKFFGKAGEEYVQFKPDAKSPKILVSEKSTGKLLASGRFGGC